MLLIMCRILNNVKGKSMFLGKNLRYDGETKAEVTCSYAIQITAVET